MSAIAHQDHLFSYSLHRISKSELLRSLSIITWTSQSVESSLAAIAAAIRRVPGLAGFGFELVQVFTQQLGIRLKWLNLHRQQAIHRSHLESLHRIIAHRKLIHRATHIRPYQRNTSEPEALGLMVSYARTNRRKLLNIAESLVFGFDCSAFIRPSLRRLPQSEFITNLKGL